MSRGDKVKKLVLGREVPEFKDLENSQSMNFAKKKKGGVDMFQNMDRKII